AQSTRSWAEKRRGLPSRERVYGNWLRDTGRKGYVTGGGLRLIGEINMERRGQWWRGILLAVALALASGPVALACGIYIPREGDGVIVQERALIRFVDGVEEIVMELAVSGETTAAAWILPVPNP